MCEFDVMLDGEKVFEEAIYLRREKEKLLIRNILGEERKLDDVKIKEIDVSKEKLTLGK